MFDGWELRDPLGRRVGRVSKVFLARTGRAAHVEVALGPFGTRPVLLCPSTGSGWTGTPASSPSGRTADGRPETNRDIRMETTQTSENPYAPSSEGPPAKRDPGTRWTGAFRGLLAYDFSLSLSKNPPNTLFSVDDSAAKTALWAF